MEVSVKEVPMWDCIFRIQRSTSCAARLGKRRRLVRRGEIGWAWTYPCRGPARPWRPAL